MKVMTPNAERRHRALAVPGAQAPHPKSTGVVSFEDSERWLAEVTRASADQIEKNLPPLHEGEPFLWIEKSL